MAIKEYQGTPNRPGKKGYVTKVFTGADVRKARGMLDQQARESAAKIREEKVREWVHPMRNHKGSVRHVKEKHVETIRALQKAHPELYPKGTPASRPTFSLGAWFKTNEDGTKTLVRDGEE